MKPDERETPPDPHLIAAARVAVSWARSRRATWTRQPLAPARPVLETPVPPEVSIEEDSPRPSMFASLVARARAATPAIGRWKAIGRWSAIAAVGGVLVGVVAVGVHYGRQHLPGDRAPRAESDDDGRAAQAMASPPARGGALHVTSTPSGARVTLDGNDRGPTPLMLGNVNAGAHEITLTSDAGTVHRRVNVVAGQTIEVDESIFPGWVAVLAPFDVVAAEDGRALRIDDHDQIMLPPGQHALQLTNASLSFTTVERVEVKPGAVTTLRVTPPTSTLTVTATDVSEVWMDGTRIGVTPLTAVPAPLGTHEIVVKRTGGGERRFSIAIGTRPFTLNADAPP